MKFLKSGLLVLTMLSPNFALARGGGGGGGGPGHMKKMAEELAFTDAQKAEMKKIHESGQESMKAQRAAVKAAKKALGEAVASPASTKEQLIAAHEKFAQAKHEMMRQQFARVVEIRALLTPEQLAKFPKVAPLDRGGDGDDQGPNDGNGMETK